MPTAPPEETYSMTFDHVLALPAQGYGYSHPNFAMPRRLWDQLCRVVPQGHWLDSSTTKLTPYIAKHMSDEQWRRACNMDHEGEWAFLHGF